MYGFIRRMLTGSFPLFDLFFSFPNSSPFSEALSFQVPQFGVSPQEEERASPQAFPGSCKLESRKSPLLSRSCSRVGWRRSGTWVGGLGFDPRLPLLDMQALTSY